MKTVIRGALAAAILSAASASGQAADLPSIKEAPPPPPVFVDSYQPFQVRLKVGAVLPLDGTSTIYDAGSVYPVSGLRGAPSVGLLAGVSGGPYTVVPGAGTSISWSVIPMLDVAYYLTKNWAIEAICCVSNHHVQGTGVLAGADLGRTWVFPPSAMIQYHFTNFGHFQPYLGVGVNFTAYFGTRAGNNNWALAFAPGSALGPAGGLGLYGANASFYNLNLSPSWGVVGQAGFDYMFNEHWGWNFDLKYIMMEPNGRANIVAFTPQAPGLGAIYVPVTAAVKINPLVISTGVTFRFGGGSAAPIVAKY